MAHANANDCLGQGDALLERAAQDGTSVGAVAEDAGVPRQAAYKASWLARTYDTAARRRLGTAVLGKVTPMHLEVVARRADREELLRRAAEAGLTARDLRKVARAEPREGRAPDSTVESLKRSARAMKQYAKFDDRALQVLLHGPNGDDVRHVANAGRQLAERVRELSY